MIPYRFTTDGSPATNGAAGRFSFPPPPAPPPEHAKSPPDEPRRRNTFSLADTGRLGYRLCLHVAPYLLGLGTTGSQVVAAIIRRFDAEWRRPHRPQSWNYLMVDAAAASPGMDPNHFIRIEGGVDGAGTDPREGFALFHTAKNYRQLRHALNAHLVRMAQNDADLPWSVPTRQAVNFWVVAGAGGTSGGTLHAAIALLHDLAAERSIQQPRVHVVLLGPEMALRDRTRQVAREVQQLVRTTAANNLTKLLADYASSALLEERRPDGSTLSVQACRRVFSITLADQSNGDAECSTTEGLVQQVSTALFARIFTRAGKYFAERSRDLEPTGVTGRGTPQGDHP